MRPLQSIAMGLVIVGLHASFSGYDALPDPVGWVLVLFGTSRLPPDVVRRGTLLALAALAGAVAVPLWLPSVSDGLYDLHPSLGWAVNLPQLGYAIVLADTLARRAVEAEEPRATAWLRTAVTGSVLAAVLPVLVFGGGLSSLEVATYLLASLTLLLLICLLFSYAGRAWAQPHNDPAAPKST